jgi:hypothetical protein
MKRQILYAGLCLAAASCATAPPKAVAPPVAAPAPLDPSYDWHVLLTSPMGSLLKDMPVTLHEVLLFRDEDKRADANEGDCYAIDATAPTFIARVPDEYLLCFKHDRLARIEATVRVPQDQAAKIFGDACTLWFKNAALPAPAIPAATEASAATCGGQDGSSMFNGRLEAEPDQADQPLSINIDAVEQR